MPSFDENRTMTSSYVNRLAARDSGPIPNYYGNEAHPTSSFEADLQAAGVGGVDFATGAGGAGAGGAGAVASAYADGGQNALGEPGSETHDQFKASYEQNGTSTPTYDGSTEAL